MWQPNPRKDGPATENLASGYVSCVGLCTAIGNLMLVCRSYDWNTPESTTQMWYSGTCTINKIPVSATDRHMQIQTNPQIWYITNGQSIDVARAEINHYNGESGRDTGVTGHYKVIYPWPCTAYKTTRQRMSFQTQHFSLIAHPLVYRRWYGKRPQSWAVPRAQKTRYTRGECQVVSVGDIGIWLWEMQSWIDGVWINYSWTDDQQPGFSDACQYANKPRFNDQTAVRSICLIQGSFVTGPV